MLLKYVRCGRCSNSLPRGPGFFGFKPCPGMIACNSCNAQIRPTKEYRYTYYFRYCWKVCFFLSIPFMAYETIQAGDAILLPLLVPLGALFVGGGAGFIISFVLAIPLMLVLDFLGLLFRMGGKNKR